jgi:hypothetical protein
MHEDYPTTNEVPVLQSPPTERVAAVGVPLTASDGHVSSESGFDAGTDADEWPSRGPSRGLRLRLPTAILLAVLIALGGIWGGAALQRDHGTTASVSSSFPSFLGGAPGIPSFLRGAAGASSGSTSGIPAAFGGGGAASGTVTVIRGDTVWVTTASGSLVKVLLSPSTTYTRDAESTQSALKPGDTVVVQGTKSKAGNVAATSVAATASGVIASNGLGGGG